MHGAGQASSSLSASTFTAVLVEPIVLLDRISYRQTGRASVRQHSLDAQLFVSRIGDDRL